MNNTVTITLDDLDETMCLLNALAEKAREYGAQSANEHLWALGSKTNKEAIEHEMNSDIARKNRTTLLSIIEEVSKQKIESIRKEA